MLKKLLLIILLYTVSFATVSCDAKSLKNAGDNSSDKSLTPQLQTENIITDTPKPSETPQVNKVDSSETLSKNSIEDYNEVYIRAVEEGIKEWIDIFKYKGIYIISVCDIKSDDTLHPVIIDDSHGSAWLLSGSYNEEEKKFTTHRLFPGRYLGERIPPHTYKYSAIITDKWGDHMLEELERHRKAVIGTFCLQLDENGQPVDIGYVPPKVLDRTKEGSINLIKKKIQEQMIDLWWETGEYTINICDFDGVDTTITVIIDDTHNNSWLYFGGIADYGIIDLYSKVQASYLGGPMPIQDRDHGWLNAEDSEYLYNMLNTCRKNVIETYTLETMD